MVIGREVPRFYDRCATGGHNCVNDDHPCGCRCANCIDVTEPRCDICNNPLVKGVCPDAPDCSATGDGGVYIVASSYELRCPCGYQAFGLQVTDKEVFVPNGMGWTFTCPSCHRGQDIDGNDIHDSWS